MRLHFPPFHRCEPVHVVGMVVRLQDQFPDAELTPLPSLVMTGPASSLPYGPNTAAVRRFLQRLAGKSAADCVAFARAYVALRGTPRFAEADIALGHAIESSDRTGPRDAVVGPIVQLMGGHAERLMNEPELADVTVDDMAECALAAALGLIVGDIIAGDALELLYRPFADAIPIAEVERGAK